MEGALVLLLLLLNPFCSRMDERKKNTEKQLIVIMNNLSKTNDALRMTIEPNMEIGISYLMRRLNCIVTGNIFHNGTITLLK